MKPDMKEIDFFLKNLGMEDVIDQLGATVTNNFMIKGEVTENLEEVLQRAPDSLIDLILNEMEGMTEDTGRKEKESILLSGIPEYFKTQMISMDLIKLKLLLKVMSYQQLEPMELATVMAEFIPNGWVFNFGDGETYQLVVTEQIQSILMKLNQEDVKKKLEASFMIRSIFSICLRLYGVFSKELFWDIYKIFILDGLEQPAEDMISVFHEMLKVLEKERRLSVNGNYIVSSEVRSDEQYKEILNIQKKKAYYVPGEKEIEAYLLGKWADRTKEYEEVFNCLNSELRDLSETEEMLDEIAKRVAVDDWNIPEIMNCLFEWDVAFTNDNSVVRLTRAMSEWLYTIRRWSEFGNSRKDMQLPNDQDEYILSSNLSTQKTSVGKKIYPNDPCPCGSGKKYKKCCGKPKSQSVNG